MIFKSIWFFRGLLYKVLFKRIGNLSYLGKPTFIRGFKNISIGKKVRIFPGVRLEAFDGGKIIIEDNVSISNNVQITSSRGILLIKKNTKILANTYITNLDWDYSDPEIIQTERNIKYQETIINENCFIGIGCCINAGSWLGKNCIVGSNSWVRGKFDENKVIAGTPAKVLKTIK